MEIVIALGMFLAMVASWIIMPSERARSNDAPREPIGLPVAVR